MVLLKLDSMSGCMDMNRSDMMSQGMKMAQPLWQCMFAHMHMHTSVMICRNPMTQDITAHEKGMMMVCPPLPLPTQGVLVCAHAYMRRRAAAVVAGAASAAWACWGS